MRYFSCVYYYLNDEIKKAPSTTLLTYLKEAYCVLLLQNLTKFKEQLTRYMIKKVEWF